MARAATRLPLLVLVLCLLGHVHAAGQVRSQRDLGLPSDGTVTLRLSSPIGANGTTDVEVGLQALRELLVAQPSSAVLTAAADAGIVIGVYDTEGTWPTLPLAVTDQDSDERVVAVRTGSALAFAGSRVADSLGAETLVTFEGSEMLARADAVYPLLSADDLRGTLLVHGPPRSAIDSAVEKLRTAGYRVGMAEVPSFAAEVLGSPLMQIMIVMVVLAAVSANAAWLMQGLQERAQLQISVTLGRRPMRAGADRLARWVLPWSVAYVLGTAVLVAVAIFVWSGFPPWAAALWTAAGGADIVVALTLLWVQGVIMARAGRPS